MPRVSLRLLIFLFLLPAQFAAGQVRLHELVAANATGLTDEDGDTEDWIEIHNPGSTPVNLGGWTLTDDPARPDRWSFPQVTLGAGRFLVVFASGKDRRPTALGARLHANFKLDRNGEYVGLFA